ncbi:hypothetical protein FQA39_LY12276 [Lamprigera yunnana]|nr:hypothetical protein FQA39_LY12276 [Lamprigera yunnana]
MLYVYLSKKIAIPTARVTAIDWNKQDGYLAVGGEDGMLKIIKLDSGNENGRPKSRTAPSTNLSVNKTLEGHFQAIRVIKWNPLHRKLTTSDHSGMIIVWVLYKGTWYDEMANNRKKSLVADMAWNFDGTKICIVYEDGEIIVGSVDGNRIWSKELKHVVMSKVQWSPNGKLLLFAFANGHIHIYDSTGLFVGTIDLLCLMNLKETFDTAIAGMEWFNGHQGDTKVPTLAICCKNGFLQLMRSEYDPSCIVVDTKMFVSTCSWNHNGSILAVVGKQQLRDENKSSNVVQFYSLWGEHIRSLKLPGQIVSCCVWEEGSLRIAFGIDSSVYFANARPDHKWCFFKNIVVFVTPYIYKSSSCVTFWDTENEHCHTQDVVDVIDVASYGNYCVMATSLEVNDPLGHNCLSLCDTLGTVIDVKYVEFEIKWVAMNETHVAAASKTNYFLWMYKNPQSSNLNLKGKDFRIFHSDIEPEVNSTSTTVYPPMIPRHTVCDPICSIALSNDYLIVGRESGTIKQLVVPHVVVVKTYNLPIQVYKMSINYNSTRLSVIDITGSLTVLDISDSSLNQDGEDIRLERKDVWAMKWSSENPQLLAVMEKTRMYVFKGIYPEEPISAVGYICSFENLKIQAVMLDEVINSRKPSKKYLFDLEVKSLRVTRELLEKVSIKEAHKYVLENPHPLLWNLLGDAALKELDLKLAEKSFVQSENYAGIVFIKKLNNVRNKDIARGMVASYLKDYDEAIKLYNQNGHGHLSVNLLQNIGDWFRIIQMIKCGYPATERLLNSVYNNAGDACAHLDNWPAAKEYYELVKNKKKMVESYFHLEDYKSLENLADRFDSDDPVLADIARGLAIEGDYTSAIKLYLKMGNVKSALNLAIKNHRWEQTVYIARYYPRKEISEILLKYSVSLEKENKIHRAIEINVHAKYWLNAAKYITKLAKQYSAVKADQPIRVKRMYVCIGKLVEMFKKEPDAEEAVWDVIDTTGDFSLVENCWEGAIGYHLCVLAQRQLHAQHPHEAVCSLYRLQNYTTYLPPEQIFAMLGLASYLDKQFSLCSKMFLKLSTLSDLSKERKLAYEKLALKIFSKHEPINQENEANAVDCFNCQSTIFDWETICPCCSMHFPLCVVSGKSIIMANTRTKTCSTCHSLIMERNLDYRKYCPLCHSSLTC